MELLLEAVEEPEMATASSSSSTASSWGLRQQKAAQRWTEARPFHLKCLLDTHNVGHPVCSHCNEDAVIRWEVIYVDSCYIGFILQNTVQHGKSLCWLVCETMPVLGTLLSCCMN